MNGGAVPAIDGGLCAWGMGLRRWCGGRCALILGRVTEAKDERDERKCELSPTACGLRRERGAKDEGDQGTRSVCRRPPVLHEIELRGSGDQLSTKAMMKNTTYAEWFSKITGDVPHEWQRSLGEDAHCRERMIRIPTGFGKTAGVVLAWLHHRTSNSATKHGLDAWCSATYRCVSSSNRPERAIKTWLVKFGIGRARSPGLHVLMGGVRAQRWVERPELPAILVGTQDMLLSRALNRGYATGRANWPMEFGLLHQDALWVLDEVQLMDVGLATSAQLAAFRDADRAKRFGALRPAHTWWMSATLQPRWLRTVDRSQPTEPALSIPAAQREGGLFDINKKLVRASDSRGAASIAACARAQHAPNTLTLVVVNTVLAALDVYDALAEEFSEGKAKRRRSNAPALELVHSRFRGLERARSGPQTSLHRKALMPGGWSASSSPRRWSRRSVDISRSYACDRAGPVAEPGAAIWPFGALRRLGSSGGRGGVPGERQGSRAAIRSGNSLRQTRPLRISSPERPMPPHARLRRLKRTYQVPRRSCLSSFIYTSLSMSSDGAI